MRRGCLAMRGHNRWASPAALLAMAGSVGVLLGGSAVAGACPAETESVRDNEPMAQRLPDCRAYEQVSPVDKNTTDADGKPGHVQSSPTGESVTYYSVVPFPGIPGSSDFPYYLGMRGGAGWSTQGLLPLVEPYAEGAVRDLDDSNEETIVEVTGEEGRLLAPGAKPDEYNLYVHNNVTGEYRLIAAAVYATSVDATPDGSHVLLDAVLLEEGQELAGVTDPGFVPYLFEWDRETGQVSFVGVVREDEAPKGGTVAGSYENEGENTYDQTAISEDGSRIFFSEAGENQRVYMREPSAERTVEVSAGQALWKAATPSGSFALYVEGEELYRFNVDRFEESKKPEPEALAEAREKLASAGAKVLGTVGMSDDGSYVYFVAEGVIPGENEASATVGAPNLYEWHEGASTPIRFIATLSDFWDESDWLGFARSEEAASAQGYKASRVSTDGRRVLSAREPN